MVRKFNFFGGRNDNNSNGNARPRSHMKGSPEHMSSHVGVGLNPILLNSDTRMPAYQSFQPEYNNIRLPGNSQNYYHRLNVSNPGNRNSSPSEINVPLTDSLNQGVYQRRNVKSSNRLGLVDANGINNFLDIRRQMEIHLQ